jgi:phosphoribosylformylglycinamidine synthase
MELPIRHGEGRFVAGSPSVASALRERNLIAVTYEGENPNGSELDVAGITDTTGRVLGLMPHPEAFMYPENHPRWTREGIGRGAGLDILANGVRWLEKG